MFSRSPGILTNFDSVLKSEMINVMNLVSSDEISKQGGTMSVDLGFTLQGRGGQAFSWIDTAGGTQWSALAAYNFPLMPPGPWTGLTSGSSLLSTPFAIAAGQKLTVISILATAHYDPYYDVGFALLVQSSHLKEVLFALRPDGVDQNGGGPGPNVFYAKPSPGVTVTPKVQGPAMVMLDGITYGPPVNSGSGQVSTIVQTVSAPAAGTYQLLFGVFNTNDSVDITRPSALIVQYVDVR
jgi:hypothetical protein